MKSYHSISTMPRDNFFDFQVYLFEKLDGSLIRAEWSKKQGFYKFGSKNELIDDKHPFLAKSISLIHKNYDNALRNAFEKRKIERAVCFFEFLGPNSFAGWHDLNDEHEVILFDISVYKKGLLPPEEFLELTHDFAELVRLPKWIKTKLTADVIALIQNSELAESSFEGVVIKFLNKKKQLEMFKLKTNAWFHKLKEKCGDNKALFEKLK